MRPDPDHPQCMLEHLFNTTKVVLFLVLGSRIVCTSVTFGIQGSNDEGRAAGVKEIVMRMKLGSKFTLAIFALMAMGFGVTACSVDSSGPVDEQIFEGRLQSAQIHRFMDEDLRQLAPGETVFVDLTQADVGLVIEYTDATLLQRVRVRDSSGEFILADRMTTITASDGPSRVIMASDQELQMELAQAKAIPSLDAQLAQISCICKECHMDGTILHCTGCKCWAD